MFSSGQRKATAKVQVCSHVNRGLRLPPVRFLVSCYYTGFMMWVVPDNVGLEGECLLDLKSICCCHSTDAVLDCFYVFLRLALADIME